MAPYSHLVALLVFNCSVIAAYARKFMFENQCLFICALLS